MITGQCTAPAMRRSSEGVMSVEIPDQSANHPHGQPSTALGEVRSSSEETGLGWPTQSVAAHEPSDTVPGKSVGLGWGE